MIAVPGDSLDIILRHAPAGGVPHPEVFLRFVVALRSGEAEPGDRFGIILRHATASGVPPPEDELRVGIASHGEGSDVYEGAALRLAQVRRHHPLGNGAVRQHDLRAEVIS